MKEFFAAILLTFAVFSVSYAETPTEPVAVVDRDAEIPKHLQEISVTIKTDRGEGSGVIITREVKVGDKVETINFVWTAAHVVESLRSSRTAVDPVSGQSRIIIEFKDPSLVKELTENGRRVGELKMDAKVLKYSDATSGEDLALLIVRKRNFVKDSATFYLDTEDNIVPIGTKLYHVGSLLGQGGANSMTAGIMSQIGRTINLGGGEGTVFDQTTVTAFPGSSGGGVFLANSGQYIGMLVRGAGETFNFVVPIRRMKNYAERAGVLWALDPKVPVPAYEEIMKLNIEGVAGGKVEMKKAEADTQQP